jgi:hypothetical protein
VQRAVRRVDILRPQQAQLLTTQCSVIRESEHKPITHRFDFGCVENRAPLLVGRNPWEFDEPRDKATFAPPSEELAWRVAPTANWVAIAVRLLDEIVIEQAHGNQPLL